MKTIYLCGFMGCGKTTIGRRLARIFHCPLIDLDRYITEKYQRTIPQIFEKDGETAFRRMEEEAIREMPSENTVVSTGGGALLNPNTAETARENGTVIFLDVSFNTCYKRIKGDSGRPLAINNTKDGLKKIYKKRKPVYRKNSDFTINGDRPIKEILKNIIDIISD